MEKYVRFLVTVLKNQVLGKTPDAAPFLQLTEEEREKLLDLSRKHSVSQLVGDALGKDPAIGMLPAAQPWIQDTMQALGQTEVMEYDRQQICNLFRNAGIPYIQLKGARIRTYYPEPWMRSSGDIDILVHEEDAERAAQLLEEQLHCSRGERCYHDILLTTPSGVDLELHFSLRINIPKIDRILAQVWEQSDLIPGTCESVQSNAFFIFHIVAHMVHHFLSGGFGIRFLLDYFLLQQRLSWQDSIVVQWCEQSGIDTFYRNIKKLTDVWFRDAAYTPEAQHMEDYILEGGIFGSRKNGIAIQQNQHDSRFYYLLHRVFPSADYMRATYPGLRGHSWLLPAYHIRRWISEYKNRKLTMVKSVMHLTQDMDPETVSAVRQLLEDNDMLN